MGLIRLLGSPPLHQGRLAKLKSSIQVWLKIDLESTLAPQFHLLSTRGPCTRAVAFTLTPGLPSSEPQPSCPIGFPHPSLPHPSQHSHHHWDSRQLGIPPTKPDAVFATAELAVLSESAAFIASARTSLHKAHQRTQHHPRWLVQVIRCIFFNQAEADTHYSQGQNQSGMGGGQDGKDDKDKKVRNTELQCHDLVDHPAGCSPIYRHPSNFLAINRRISPSTNPLHDRRPESAARREEEAAPAPLPSSPPFTQRVDAS